MHVQALIEKDHALVLIYTYALAGNGNLYCVHVHAYILLNCQGKRCACMDRSKHSFPDNTLISIYFFLATSYAYAIAPCMCVCVCAPCIL